MKLEEIQELGHAAIAIKTMADALTDEKLKDKLYRYAGLIGDAHDELLMVLRHDAMLADAAEKAVAEMGVKKIEA